MTKRTLTDSLSIRLARARHRKQSSPFLRFLGGRGAATLLIGGALSVGGLSQAFEGVHFLVEKDLDAVRVVKEDGADRQVVARLHDGFAANSVFKLSQILPDRYVSRQRSLFDDAWLPEEQEPAKTGTPKHDLFHTEMAKINQALRREFFSTSMPFGDLIHEKAVKYDVDPALVAAVIEQESRFRKDARSHVGARGLMQLMPRTGRWMGARNLYDPEQNIDAGVRYIKYLQKRFDGNVKKTIAAYNAGEGNVKRYDGVPPFRETQSYVKKVMSNYEKRNQQLKKFGAEQREDEALTADGTVTLR